MTDPGPAMGTIRTAIIGHAVAGEQGITFHRPSLLDRTDQLNKAIEQVEEAYAELRARLEPVVIPSVPSPSPGDVGRLASVNSDEPSWIAGYFDDVTARVHGLAGSIAAFTARIDL